MRRNALSRFLAACVFAAGACLLGACGAPSPPDPERPPKPEAALAKPAIANTGKPATRSASGATATLAVGLVGTTAR